MPEPELGTYDADAEINVPEEVYLSACVNSVKEGLTALREKKISYPIMIKASEGGGGKGIRKCNSDEEFRLNFRRVQVSIDLIFILNFICK